MHSHSLCGVSFSQYQTSILRLSTLKKRWYHWDTSNGSYMSCLYVSLLPMRGAGGISHQKEINLNHGSPQDYSPLCVLLDTLDIVNTITTRVSIYYVGPVRSCHHYQILPTHALIIARRHMTSKLPII